jgi:hypothetical protein
VRAPFPSASALAPRSLPASPAHRLAPLPALGHRLAAPLAAATRAIHARASSPPPQLRVPQDETRTPRAPDELARYR